MGAHMGVRRQSAKVSLLFYLSRVSGSDWVDRLADNHLHPLSHLAGSRKVILNLCGFFFFLHVIEVISK